MKSSLIFFVSLTLVAGEKSACKMMQKEKMGTPYFKLLGIRCEKEMIEASGVLPPKPTPIQTPTTTPKPVVVTPGAVGTAAENRALMVATYREVEETHPSADGGSLSMRSFDASPLGVRLESLRIKTKAGVEKTTVKAKASVDREEAKAKRPAKIVSPCAWWTGCPMPVMEPVAVYSGGGGYGAGYQVQMH